MARILVVTYFYPPDPTGGGHRWATQAKYLRRLGHEVSVVAPATFGTLPDDAGLGVVRTGDLAASSLLRRALRRGSVAGTEPAGTTRPAPPTALTRTLVPDPYVVSWIPYAARTARRLARERPVDCVITTSPPESTHLVGRMLARRGVAWIADFRDGWSFEPIRDPFPTGAQRAADAWLERHIATRADGVLAATKPIADDLRTRFGVQARPVLNAWDADLDAEVADAPPVLAEDGHVNLVHTGTLSGAWGRDPRPIFAALREVDDPRLRLVLAGRPTAAERGLFADLERAGRVVLTGQLPRAGALALQRQADALLLVTSPQASEATGKVFEYLAAGRPILALAGANEAARIVRDTGTGTVVAPEDGPGIVTTLRGLLDGGLERDFSPRGLEAYRYPGPARLVAEAVEEAVALAAARQLKQR